MIRLIKGVRRMMLIIGGVLGTVACHGCATAPQYYYTGQAAAPLSEGMRLAAGEGFASTDPLWDAANAPEVSTQALLDSVTRTMFSKAGVANAAPLAFNLGSAETPAVTVSVATPEGPDLFDAESLLRDPLAQFAALQSRPGEFGLPAIGPADARAFAAEIAIDVPRERSGLGLDVGITPRANYRNQGDLTVRGFGAELRIGEFDQRGTGARSNSWYVFASADGEALVWETGDNGVTSLVNNVKLRDAVTVGDLQAGVSIHKFGGEFSLSYIRRETEFRQGTMDVNEVEDFGGVSFTLRR